MYLCEHTASSAEIDAFGHLVRPNSLGWVVELGTKLQIWIYVHICLRLRERYEVSLNKLATQLKIDVKTVQRYLDLLEQTFVIIRLGGFSRNLRKEVTRKNKFYFFDNGLRNALIVQFNRLDQRNDIGALWENFIFVERLKHRIYTSQYANMYFWRTYDQQGIDLVEERDGHLYGYECKWSTKKNISAPKSWLETYAEASFQVITPNNYLDFIC